MSLLPLPVRAVATSTFRSLRVRNFRLFWFGQMVSVSGTWMQSVAQNWLVLSLTGSGVALGVTVALQFLPMLLFGMWGGLIADRFDKRRILFVTQVVPMALALVMFVLVATGAVALWMVYALAFLLGLVFMVDMPTRQSFVVELVGPDELPNAVGLNSAMFNTGRVVGPALAGVLIATVGTASTFLLNAASYAAVLVALGAMRPVELFPQSRAERAPGAIRAGLRYVWSTPVLRSTLLLVAVVGTFGMNFTVVLPLLARYTFDGGAPLYGWLTSAMSLGSLLGALVSAGRVGPTRTMLICSGAAFGALTLVASVAPSPLLVGGALVMVGVAIMLFLATANTTLQLACEPAMRGRVMALYGLVFLGSTPLEGPSWAGSRAGGAAGGDSPSAAPSAWWRPWSPPPRPWPDGGGQGMVPKGWASGRRHPRRGHRPPAPARPPGTPPEPAQPIGPTAFSRSSSHSRTVAHTASVQVRFTVRSPPAPPSRRRRSGGPELAAARPTRVRSRPG